MPIVKQPTIKAPAVGDLWVRIHSDGTETARIMSVFLHKNEKDFTAAMLPARAAAQRITANHRIDRIQDWHPADYFGAPEVDAAPAQTQFEVVAEHHSLVGTMSDTDLGKQIGVARISVANYRGKKGIPKFGTVL